MHPQNYKMLPLRVMLAGKYPKNGGVRKANHVSPVNKLLGCLRQMYNNYLRVASSHLSMHTYTLTSSFEKQKK